MSRETDNIDNDQKEVSKIKISNIIYPILIGVGVVFYMIYDEFDANAFKSLTFNNQSLFWIFIAILFMFGRDIGYIIRLKVLAEDKISWIEATRAIMLWEFTSAITPSVVGGTSVAVIYVHKAGISVGKSGSIVLLTSFLDELYFIIMFPLIIWLIGLDTLFDLSFNHKDAISNSFKTLAFIGYSLKLTYMLFVFYGLFINPRGIKWLLIKIFSLSFLKKYKGGAIKSGNDIIESSKSLKRKNFIFWIKVIISTFVSWSSRYMVVNAILLAFFTIDNHILLFGRQLVMWIMMLIMPTPGGSGFSEYMFSEYLGDFIPITSLAIIMALIWRIITYYPYLFIGAIIFPAWAKKNFSNKNKPTKKDK